MINKSLQVKLGKWQLDNPIIGASGTFGYGFEYQNYFDINLLGSFSFKGTTPQPREGNGLPRICEVNQGLINSIGLQNPGVDHVLKYELPALKKIYHKKIIANIAATEISGYVKLIKKLNSEEIIAIYEVNVSCPNVDKGALKFDSDPVALTKLIQTIKPIAKKPLYIKLSPQVTSIVLMAKTAEKAGADGLVLINTVPGLRIDLNSKQPIMANKIGGMSGPAIKPIVLRAVYLCYQAVNIPIIGVGGISSADDVIEMMLAGATAVEIGSECLVNPYACTEIINDLPKQMKKYNIKALSEIIGQANK